MIPMPDALVDLLKGRALCYIATSMPSGSPQLTLTWVDTDGEHVLVNSVLTHQKVRNLQRDPRVAVAISDPQNPWMYYQVRGRVASIETEGGAEDIERLSQKYRGEPYGWWGGRDQQRVIITIEPEHIHSPRG